MRNAAGKTAAEVKTEKFNKELKENRNTLRKDSALHQHELGVKAFLKGEDVDAAGAGAGAGAGAVEEEGKEGGKRTMRHRTRKPKHTKTRKYIQ
jgi:hypothetical protein